MGLVGNILCYFGYHKFVIDMRLRKNINVIASIYVELRCKRCNVWHYSSKPEDYAKLNYIKESLISNTKTREVLVEKVLCWHRESEVKLNAFGIYDMTNFEREFFNIPRQSTLPVFNNRL